MSDNRKPARTSGQANLHAALDIRDAAFAERDAAFAARDRLREAVLSALSELGAPDETYPAPIDNAVRILSAALAYRGDER